MIRRVRDSVVVSLGAAFVATCAPRVPPSIDAAMPDVATPGDVAPDVFHGAPPYVDRWQCSSAGAVLPLDEPLDASHARAGRVASSSELIGGEGAFGQIGHFKIYNARVRFIVQSTATPAGPMRPVGYDLYGGNIIDADLVRPAGAPGQDVFRETFPTIGFRASSADEVTVVCDGSGGQPAAIRVVGSDRATRLITALDTVARPQYAQVITHYVLAPGTSVLELHTEIASTIGQAIRGAVTGDFLAFGRGVSLFTAVTGFGDPMLARNGVSMVLGASDPGEGGRHVSYGFAPSHGTMILPFADESGTFGQYDDINAAEGARAEFVRYFAIGSGDVASVAGALMDARGDAHGTIQGRASPSALVYAFTSPYGPGATARSVARAAADGTYAMPIAPGAYDVMALDQGTLRGQPISVTVDAAGIATANPLVGATGTLVLDVATITDAGARVREPTTVSLIGSDIEAPDPSLGNLEGERESHGLARVVFALTGTETIALKPGHYVATVSRGVEYDSVQSSVAVPVPVGGSATLRAELRRVVDTIGYVSGDFHQHTIGSVDAPRTLCNRVLENAAEGLEYAATTDHDNTSDFAPCIQALQVGTWFNATVGNEISVIGIGHFNAYPLAIDSRDPYRLVGAQYWADQTIQQLFTRVRAETSDPILHVSHPRSGSLKGYFTWLGLDPLTLAGRQPLAMGFEALEVNDSIGTPDEFLPSADAMIHAQAVSDPGRIPVLHDLFAMLSRGDHTCGLGNSDTHARNDSSGWPRNFLRVGTDEPAQVSVEQVRAAIRAQRVIVSNGIVIKVRVAGQERMGWTEVVPALAGRADLDVEVQAAPWIGARWLAAFENGRPVALNSDGVGGFDAMPNPPSDATLTVPLATTGTVRLRATVHVHPARDSYYVFVAGGDSIAPIGKGSAYGYTNGVYVDADGGGWMPPGL